MAGNYPPGAENDPRAPYNQPPAPVCDGCGETILSEESHQEGCSWSDIEVERLREEQEKAAEIEHAEMQLEEFPSPG